VSNKDNLPARSPATSQAKEANVSLYHKIRKNSQLRQGQGMQGRSNATCVQKGSVGPARPTELCNHGLIQVLDLI